MLASNSQTEQASSRLPAANDFFNIQSNSQKNLDPVDKQFEQFANFGAFLKQKGTLPISFQNPDATKNIQNPVQALNKPNSTQSTGDLISSQYHTYNSIGTLAPLVSQDENLSIALNSKNVKIFLNEDPNADAKNLIVFVENIQTLQQPGSSSQLLSDSLGLQQSQMVDTSNNISFLVNQNDQITNILSSYHQKNMLLGTILDFTVRKFRFLYILYAKSIVILDFKNLIQHSDSSVTNNQNHEIQIVDSIQLIQPNISLQKSLHLNNLHLFNSIEVLNSNDQSLLLFNDIASRRAGLAFNSQNIKSSAKTAQSSQACKVSLNAANEVDSLGTLSGGKVLQNEQGIDQLKSNEYRKSQILHIDCSNFKPNESGYHGSANTQYSLQQGPHVQTLLQFGEDMSKNGSIVDIEMWQTYLAVLFEKNVILVYDFASSQNLNATELIQIRNNSQKQQQKARKNDKESLQQNQKSALQIIQFEKPIFKAKFADATESISQIFFIQDFTKVQSENSSNDQNSIDSNSEHAKYDQLSDNLETKKLKGCFLLVESKAASPNKESDSQMKETGKKAFRKLHIVEIQDPIGPLYLHENQKGNKGTNQFLKQIDQLSITEHTSKFVSYNHEQGIVFLLNMDKQDRLIRFFTVKLKKDTSELDSDSDDGHKRKDSYYFQKLRFEYITEVRLQISNQSFSAIQKVSLAKYKNIVQQAVPVYLKVLRIKSEKVGSSDADNFYIYTNILDQVLVFRRSLNDLRPTSQDLVKLLSETKNFPAKDYKQATIKQFQSTSQSGTPNLQDNKHSLIDLSNLGKIPSTYKEEILRKSREMMQGNYSESNKAIYADSEQEEDEELPMNQENLHDDENRIIGNIQRQFQDSQKIVNEILSEESDTSQPEPASRDTNSIQVRANALMEKIEKECREEAENDALLLQQIITEETKDVISVNEEENLAASIAAGFSFDEEEIIQKGKQDFQIETQRHLSSENAQTGKEKLQSLGEKGPKKDFVYIKKEKDQQIDMQENASAGKKDKKQKKQGNKKCSQINQQKKQKDCKEQDCESDSNNCKIRLNTGETQIQNHQSTESVVGVQTQSNPTPASNLINRTNSPQQQSTFQKKKSNVNSQKQQDQIVENFQELTRKYQDLAQKMNKLQQQVQRQQQQKIEVENIIRKAVRDSIGGLVNQQIKEIVVPEMTKKIKSLDNQLTEVLLPKIEEQMSRILKETVERGDLLDKQNSESEQLNQQMIQSLIQKEFREAMITKIVPSIETCIKKLLQQLENKLQQVDVALCEKLSEEEERHESMVQHYQNSLVWLKKFHIKMGNLSKEQLKGQMIQQIEYSKEIAKELQNELIQKVNDNVIGFINTHINSQQKVKSKIEQQMVKDQVQAQLQQYQAGNSPLLFDEDPQLRLQSQIQNMIQQQLHQSLHSQQYYLPQVASQHLSQSNVHPSFQPPIPSYVQQQSYSLQRKASNIFQNPSDTFMKLQQQSANQAIPQIKTSNEFDIQGSIQSPQQDTETIQIIAQLNDLQRKLKMKQQQSNQQNSASSLTVNNVQSQFSGSKKLQPLEENKFENSKYKIDFNNETGTQENDFNDLEDPDMYLNQHKSFPNAKKQSQVSEPSFEAKKKVQMGNTQQKFRDRNTPLQQQTTKVQGFDIFEELDAKRGSEKEDADDKEYGQEDFDNQLNDFLFNNNIGTTYADEPRVVRQDYKQDRNLRPYDDDFAIDHSIINENKKQQKTGIGSMKQREAFENHTDRQISALLRGTTATQQTQNANQEGIQDLSGFDGQKSFGSNFSKTQYEKQQYQANPNNNRNRQNLQKYSFTDSTGVEPANASSGIENNQNRGLQKIKTTRQLTSWKDSQQN